MPRKFQMPKKNVNKKVQQSYLKVGFVVPEGTTDEVMEDIFEVLKKTPFNKISVPVGTYRYLIDDSIAEDDNRVITVGYIKRYDPEIRVFDIAIFNANKQTIEAFDNKALELVFTEYNNKLGTITKFNIVSLPDDVEEENAAPTEEEDYDPEETVAEETAEVVEQA